MDKGHSMYIPASNKISKNQIEVLQTPEENRRVPIYQLCLACKPAAPWNIPTNPLPNPNVLIYLTSYCTLIIAPIAVGLVILWLSECSRCCQKGLSPRVHCNNISVSVATNQMLANIDHTDIHMAEILLIWGTEQNTTSSCTQKKIHKHKQQSHWSWNS